MTTKLTKNELRDQQRRLMQFEQYLPTLQLKKSMLQIEVLQAQAEIEEVLGKLKSLKEKVEAFSPFLLETVSCNLVKAADVIHVKKRYENIAGVEIPIFDHVVFQEESYSLLDTPAWTDQAINFLREFVSKKEELQIAKEKKRALEKELRDVSIRVNLFEKILIPRSKENIKKIRIFLGDQQLAAVAQAKIAKGKIAKRAER